MQARFHSPDRNAGYPGNFFQRKILHEMQQENRTLRQRQLIQEFHELSLLFLANEQFVRGAFELNRRADNLITQHFFTRPLSPALDALLMRNAEEPASEFRVLAQTAEVAHRIDERFL